MSTATKAYGSKIAVSATDASYVDIAQTVDLAGPSPEVGEISITNNDSPDNCKEYLPGMIEPGELEFEIVYEKEQCADLYAMFGDDIVYFWRETYPDGSTWKFKGFLKSFGTEGETEDGALTNTISIKLTSKPVYTATPV
ncbi:MAG TPA: phage tail tube protein [Tepidisphaeraceae bacterium]|jgi:hypothetical protein|nr:phage tail tube protein [Tepidisphaeraceae bacterium]